MTVFGYTVENDAMVRGMIGQPMTSQQEHYLGVLCSGIGSTVDVLDIVAEELGITDSEGKTVADRATASVAIDLLKNSKAGTNAIVRRLSEKQGQGVMF